MDESAQVRGSVLQRALAGDGVALAGVRRRLQNGLARAGEDHPGAGDRTHLLRGAYAAALDLLPRLAGNQDRR